jgi:hypothetical protein
MALKTQFTLFISKQVSELESWLFCSRCWAPFVCAQDNFSPSPKRKKPTTFVAGFGSLCWARTSDPLINPAHAGL